MATYGAFIKGYALTAAGQSQEGQAACEEAVRLAPERISRAYASAVLGYNYLVAGDARAAVELLPPVIEELGRFPYPPWEGLFAAKLAEAWLEVGDLAEARRAAERAVRVTESCGFPFGAGWARRALGRVAVAQGKPAEGRADLDRAREIFRPSARGRNWRTPGAASEWPLSSHFGWRRRMTQMGHQYALRPPRRDGSIAPIPDLRRSTICRPESTHCCRTPNDCRTA